MNDEQLDRMVRDADPHRPEVIPALDGAQQTLLEEIMSTPILESAAGSPRRPRRTLVRGLAGAVAAAAVITGVFAVSIVNRDQPDTHRAAPPSGSGVGGPVVFSPAAMEAAKKNPRLLIDEPGWKATTVYGFAEAEGTIAFAKGARTLEMNWYPANQYDSYHKDRMEVSAPEAVKVDGVPGDVFTYSDNDFAVMMKPRDDAFVEMRTSGGWTRKQFDQVLGDVIRVDVHTWLAALPPEIVTPGNAAEAARQVLADVPLPPGFDAGQAVEGLGGANDPYQFGAEVTRNVGCAWTSEWARAEKAGDEAAAQKAKDALRSSKQWKVLHDMNAEGDWPESYWELSDQISKGMSPQEYTGALQCGQ